MARVLVVDDIPDNIKLLTYELADEGHEVLVAHDGPEALAQAESERPDVILLDIMMPGLDGIEVCRRLKANPDLRAIPVIMVSARGQEVDVIAGLDAGAQDYVTKPFNLPVVLARVRAAERTKTALDHQLEQNRALVEVATIDPLTSARNRRYLETRCDAAVSFASRHELPLSLVMLDVDDFKSYNDNFGHPAGDEVLRTLARLAAGRPARARRRRPVRGRGVRAPTAGHRRRGGPHDRREAPRRARRPQLALPQRNRQPGHRHDASRRAGRTRQTGRSRGHCFVCVQAPGPQPCHALGRSSAVRSVRNAWSTSRACERPRSAHSIQLKGYVGSSSSSACLVSCRGRTRVDHHGQLVGAGHVAAGDDRAGVRAVRDAARVERERRLLDAAAAAEPAADVVEHLVGLHVRVGVRHLDRLGVRVEHPRGERAERRTRAPRTSAAPAAAGGPCR